MNLLNKQMTVAVQHTAFGGNSDTVALVHIPEDVRTSDPQDYTGALEYAYRWTNNIMGSWSRDEVLKIEGGDGEIQSITNKDYNPNVSRMQPLHINDEGKTFGLRSTSVGDTMLMDGRVFEVASFGFDEKEI